MRKTLRRGKHSPAGTSSRPWAFGAAVAAAGGRAIFSLLAGVPSELWVSVTSLVLAAVIIFVSLGLGAHIDKRLPGEIRDPSAH